MMSQAVVKRKPGRVSSSDYQLHCPGKNETSLLLLAAITLLGIGLVMIASASLDVANRQYGYASYYVVRQAIYIAVGILLAAMAYRVPMKVWEQYSAVPFFVSLVLLILVLLPGFGREVNGSMRWISLGFINIQPSELAKLAVTIYLSGYLVRRNEEVRKHFTGFVKPVSVLALMCFFLIIEPDFGSVAVMMAVALAMLFLAGARLWQFIAMLSIVCGAMFILVWVSPYRMIRITAFMDPWAAPFTSGFQLTQALIAFGRGEWFGVGLGNSIQKLFYLPEAHTDFLFSVLAEEMGLAGIVSVLLLFLVLIVSAFRMARICERAGRFFSAYMAYGLGSWIGIQAMTNIAVNMGLLPTKGLTLPLMSYGGSSLVIMCVGVGMLIRIGKELQDLAMGKQL